MAGRLGTPPLAATTCAMRRLHAGQPTTTDDLGVVAASHRHEGPPCSAPHAPLQRRAPIVIPFSDHGAIRSMPPAPGRFASNPTAARRVAPSGSLQRPTAGRASVPSPTVRTESSIPGSACRMQDASASWICGRGTVPTAGEHAGRGPRWRRGTGGFRVRRVRFSVGSRPWDHDAYRDVRGRRQRAARRAVRSRVRRRRRSRRSRGHHGEGPPARSCDGVPVARPCGRDRHGGAWGARSSRHRCTPPAAWTHVHGLRSRRGAHCTGRQAMRWCARLRGRPWSRRSQHRSHDRGSDGIPAPWDRARDGTNGRPERPTRTMERLDVPCCPA